MIRVRDLRFHYPQGDFRLEIPELSIATGERVAMIGPSGSGKTTLLHLIAGIVAPDRGRIHVGETELTSIGDSERRAFRIRNLGLVFQEFELLAYLSVLDNILLPYRIHPALRLDREVRDRAREIAGRVGLQSKLSQYATRLSQGEKQRVAVCRALLTGPGLLLADEPTGNLDPANKERVLEILCRHAADSGATLLTVTHDHDLLASFSRVIEFRDFHVKTGGGLQSTTEADG
jgi:putative ABC transport system ATP-binding protein